MWFFIFPDTFVDLPKWNAELKQDLIGNGDPLRCNTWAKPRLCAYIYIYLLIDIYIDIHTYTYIYIYYIICFPIFPYEVEYKPISVLSISHMFPMWITYPITELPPLKSHHIVLVLVNSKDLDCQTTINKTILTLYNKQIS